MCDLSDPSLAMLTTLHVSGFRDLHELEVERLGPVNLFVGANNSGKTSLLEAVEIFLGRGETRALFAGCVRREETLRSERQLLVDVCHLFHGHKLRPGAEFFIRGQNGGERSVHVKVPKERLSENELRQLGERLTRFRIDRQEVLTGLEVEERGHVDEEILALRIWTKGWDEDVEMLLPLTELGGAPYLDNLAMRRRFGDDEGVAFNFITTAGLDPRQLVRLWDGIVLGAEEAMVLDSLRVVEPRIERIAAVSREVSSGAFVLRLEGSDQRVPLGSMGDGIRRLLALSACLARSANGTVLIDEIDTGLHHTVMAKMWKLVVETAIRRKIQVFATTHSMDCVNALAALCEDEPVLKPAVLLHRVEKNRSATVLYSADELEKAAAAGIEMRGVGG